MRRVAACISRLADLGTDADGEKNDRYCKWCYDGGHYTYETTMEAMIEDCAPRLAENEDMTLDEAVSLMGAVLPQLERWRVVRENEERYGAETRGRYGETRWLTLLTSGFST